MDKKALVVLTGPTAVGKTALSIGLAHMLQAEIISCDSMQVYKYMDIGSAKIRPEEMEDVKHHLVDVLDPRENFNVVLFQQMALKAMEEIYQRGHIPLLVGGTGFYIQAIVNAIDFTENDDDPEFRKACEETIANEGIGKLMEELKRVDPASAESIHPNNTKRVIRALEYYRKTGERISDHNEKERKKNSPYNLACFVLNDDRAKLYEKINKRVDQMIEDGLIDEVKRLFSMGLTRDMISMQGLGYKEIIDYLSGDCTLEESLAAIKQGTRRYAKRQITWFKREKETIWVNKPDFSYDNEAILAFMKDKLLEKGILKDDKRADV